jgi:hypothetical protein
MTRSLRKTLFVLSIASASVLGASALTAATRITTGDRVATINADGTRENGSFFGLASSTRLGVGTYDLRWSRNITQCQALITPGSGTSFGAPARFATAVQRAGSGGTGHFIEMRDQTGALADSEFMIMVACH